jgi:hypothetical protein
MSPDWAARPTSVPYAVFGDPQSLNLYTYVENAPLNRIDADGHCANGLLDSQVSYACVAGAQENKTDADKKTAGSAHNASLWQKFKNFLNQSDPCGSNQNCVTVYAESGTLGKSWLWATSPIDKAAGWGNEHPLVIFPVALVAAAEGDEAPIEADEAEIEAPGEEAAQVLQSSGKTITNATAKALNKFFGENLHRREWGRAQEALKKFNDIANNVHPAVMSNGDVVLNGTVVGNLSWFIRGNRKWKKNYCTHALRLLTMNMLLAKEQRQFFGSRVAQCTRGRSLPC